MTPLPNDNRPLPTDNPDRTNLLPHHEGPNVLPNSPLFSKLLRHARRNRIAIRDVNLEVVKSYGDLLADALAVKLILEGTLDAVSLERLQREEEVYIGILAPGGYEFVVALLAVLAIGAAAVPMTITNPTEEAAYFVTKSRQVALLSSSSATPLALSVVDYARKQGMKVPHLEIGPHIPAKPMLSPFDMVISSNGHLNDNAAGVVIFTSGTTGRPKGAVMRRGYTHETALAIAEGYDIEPTDVLLHVLPVHHTTGLGTSIFPFLVSGACIEFRGGSFDPEWIWNRFRKGDITVFSGVPTIYMRLMWFFQQSISKLDPREGQAYIAGVNRLSILICGSSALQQPVQDFFSTLRHGRPILTRYGASEFPCCIKVPSGADFKLMPKGCVGLPVPGVELKLSSGDEGELLIKSPYMFAKYLYDPKATAEAHDKDGYFRTGDICRRSGPYYFILGRASLDIIKSGGYKISALDIEKEILDLPYIAEALVVGVEDEEFGQRVGAIITLSAESGRRKLEIQELRNALRKRLPGYKLPTLLRVVEGELPKGQTGKLQKKVLGPMFFPCPGWQDDEDVQKWSRSSPVVMARL